MGGEAHIGRTSHYDPGTYTNKKRGWELTDLTQHMAKPAMEGGCLASLGGRGGGTVTGGEEKDGVLTPRLPASQGPTHRKNELPDGGKSRGLRASGAFDGRNSGQVKAMLRTTIKRRAEY